MMGADEHYLKHKKLKLRKRAKNLVLAAPAVVSVTNGTLCNNNENYLNRS